VKRVAAPTTEESLAFKNLLFQMHSAGYSQDAIAAYLGRGKLVINELLKPLQKKKGKDSK
jgi:hypothetical protein